MMMGKSRSARGASHEPALMSSCLSVTRVCPVYLVDELIFVFLLLLAEMSTLHSCKPSLTQDTCYFQKYMLLWVMDVQFEKTL